LNFAFPETPRREVVIYRGVELPESALEGYGDGMGKVFRWWMCANLTKKREEATRVRASVAWGSIGSIRAAFGIVSASVERDLSS
jgi:hypothetical protein